MIVRGFSCLLHLVLDGVLVGLIGLGRMVITSSLALAFLVLPVSVFAASVTLEVSWPTFAQENEVSIQTTAGATLHGPYTSGGASSFTSTFGPVTLTDGDTYVINMTDTDGDGWNGGGAVTVNVDGTAVLTGVLSSGATDSFTFIASPIDQNPPPTLCNNTAAVPSGAVTLDFSDAGVDWPVNNYGTQTFTNVDGGTTGLSISISDSSTFFGVSESNGNTGNGDTAPFFMTSGMGSGSSTFTLDFSANPTRFVDLCAYHINLRGGGDKVQLSAVTDQGTVLTNPSFSSPTAATYTISGNIADGNSYTAEANGLLGVYFQAPGAERITQVELVWSEATGSSNASHGFGIGQIKFDGAATVVSADYGDAPATYGDASAAIDNNIHLGSTAPGSEATSNYDYRALGDGNEEDGAPKKSTGITLFPVLIDTDSSYTTPITVKNLTGSAATLEGWIDFNHNGTFDSGEKTTTAVPNGTNGDVSLNWPSLPSDIARGTTFIRLRLTNDTTGAGEVEDHVIGIAKPIPPESSAVVVTSGEIVRACQAIVFEDDFDDLAENTFLSPNRPTAVAIRDWVTTGGGPDTYARVQTQGPGDMAIYLGNGAVRRIIPELSSVGGLSFDVDGRLTTNLLALELRNAPDDKTPNSIAFASHWGPDEVVFSRTFASVVGKKYRLYFSGVPEGGNYVDGIMRIDTPVGSAHFRAPASGTGEISYAIDFIATSTISTIAVANYGHIGQNANGWCNPQHLNVDEAPWCSLGGNNGSDTNEVVIDDIYLVEASCDSDYSDAPADGSSAPNGSGTTDYGEVSHDIVAGIRLGASIDVDSASVTSVNAAGDGSDDDGVTIPTLILGASTTIPVVVNQNAANQGYLQGWIDWNGDGDFLDAGEQVATDLQYSAGTSGTINVPVTVPAGAITSQTFARFRWSSTSGVNSRNSAPDGEVEDYALTFTPSGNYTINTAEGNQCVASGGTLGTTNLFTDLDNGSFGTGSGAVDEIPASDPYGAQITGGTFINTFTGFGHGNYSYISNHQTPRNGSQHGGGIYDPVNGITGRFFLSDPNTSTPTFTTTLTGLSVGQSYEISFWAADSELNTSNYNRIGIIADSVEVYNTGFIANTTSVMEWKKYSFIYAHTNASSSVNFEIKSLETGAGGRDFFLDEIKIYECNIAGQILSGIVYEDIDYGGGDGRDQVSSSGVGVNGATVELYNNTGAFVTSTITANNGSNDGAYSFANVVAGDYYIRVVNGTVSSTRAGSDGSELGVQTFRTDGTTPVTGEVGGRVPAAVDGGAYDSGNASTLNTTNFTFTGGTLDTAQAQSLTPITVAAADMTGIDFGYNFDTIVNTNDSGQGSLGQFILNSNQLTDIPNQGINAGQETSIFMIPDGTGYAGTADHGSLDLTTGGIATIATSTGFSPVTDAFTALDASTQNGASCSPRTLKVVLDGSTTTVGAAIDGFTISGDHATVRGFSIGGYARHGINLSGDDALIVCNHTGLDTAGTTATPNTINGVNVSTSTNVQIGDGTTAGLNVMSGNIEQGLFIASTGAGIVVDTNYMGTTLDGLTALPNGKHGLFGANINAVGATLVIQNNVSSGNTISGVYIINSKNLSLTATNNLLGMAMNGTAALPNGGHGLHISGGGADTFNATVTNNTLSGNTQNGVWLANTREVDLTNNNIGVDTAGNPAGNGSFGIRILNSTGINVGDGTAPGGNTIANNGSDGLYVDGATEAIITRNSLYANGGLGIDLIGSTAEVTVNDANDADTGPNALLNFPLFNRISLSGTSLTIEGCAPANATIELFEADVSATSSSGATAGDNQFGMSQDYGEGETYLDRFAMPATGTACALSADADNNNSAGMLAFSETLTIPASFVEGDSLTATATVTGTGTSEFSASREVRSLDYGDAPNSGASPDGNGVNAYGDATHIIVPGVRLGSVDPDEDASSQASAIADGDDKDGTDDEDAFGAALPSIWSDQPLYRLRVSCAPQGATVAAWIDLNLNGQFDAGEQNSNHPVSCDVNEEATLNWTGLSGLTAGNTYARLRLASDAAEVADPTGVASDGEVEDYPVTIQNPGIKPSQCNGRLSWLDMSDQARGGTPWNVDWSQRNASAVFNFSTTMTGSNDKWASPNSGTTFTNPAFINQFGNIGHHVNVTYPNDLSGNGSTLVDIAFDAPLAGSTWMVVQDVDATNETLTFSGNNLGLLAAPSLWETNSYTTGNNPSIFASWDAAAQQLLTMSNGPNNDQEAYVWDVTGLQTLTAEYTTYAGHAKIGFVTCVPLDFGDAPDTYGTSKASGGAEHGVISDLYMGAARPDTESDGTPSASADADDTNAGGNDEDGVAVLPPLSHLDSSYRITVSATNATSNPGRLIAWIDFDGNGTFDADEAAARVVAAGTNAGNVTLVWSSIPSDIQQGQSYLRLRFTTDAMNAGDATGYKLDGEVEDHALSIGSSGANVSGRVYVDANSSAAEEPGEAGIGGTVVVLYDTLGNTCRSVTTTGSGDYNFAGVLDGGYELYQAHGETTPLPQSCGSAATNNPTGYQSTTPDLLTFMVMGVDVNDQDFGEVAGANSPTSGNTGAGIRFTPDHQSEILPGNVAFYAHIFSSEAGGAVRFTTGGSNNSATGWTHTLYRDGNCNGVLDGADANTPIEGINLGIAAGSTLCIVDKVYAPSNVPAQDRYDVETTATFSYAGGAPAPTVLKVKDVTTAGQAATAATPEVGESKLVLRKTVENITQLSPETESSNQAVPGDVLKYRIYYRNVGTGPITDLEVNDTVPVFTGFVMSSESCDVTPPGMTCTPMRNADDLDWAFTGSLVGGAEGHVSYEVEVDN